PHLLVLPPPAPALLLLRRRRRLPPPLAVAVGVVVVVVFLLLYRLKLRRSPAGLDQRLLQRRGEPPPAKLELPPRELFHLQLALEPPRVVLADAFQQETVPPHVRRRRQTELAGSGERLHRLDEQRVPGARLLVRPPARALIPLPLPVVAGRLLLRGDAVHVGV
ncbi:Os06g0666750, partial [Oryza sativa Japonica Group]